MNAAIVAQLVVSGALMGLVYALIAYGFQLTYATSKSINFGQGEMVMVCAFFSLTLTNLGLPYWLMVPGGLFFGVLLGLFVERAAVRLALEQKSEGWILLTIILGLFFFSAAENIWGRDDRPFPTPIPSEALHVFGISITPLEISVAVGVFTIMGLIELFKRKTLLGKAFEAVSVDRDAAELMGISATHTVMLSYGLSGLVRGGRWHPRLPHNDGWSNHGVGPGAESLLGGGCRRTRFRLRGGPRRFVSGFPRKPHELLRRERLARSAWPSAPYPGSCRTAHRLIRQDRNPESVTHRW